MMKERLSCYRGMKLLGIVVLVIVNLSLYSGDALCASKLTREKAATLIKNSDDGKVFKYQVKLLPEITKIIKERAERNEDNTLSYAMNIEKITTSGFGFGHSEYYEYSFGPLGNKNFIGFKCRQGICPSDSAPDIAVLRKPAEVKIKVNGITGSGLDMQAEYTWEYVNLPVVVKRLITIGGTGKANFKLYDDGWRLKENYYAYWDGFGGLTNKEGVELTNIINGYTAKAEIKEKRLLESQTPTQQIGSFKLHRIVQTGYSPVDASPSADVEVSDVNITVTPTEHANVGQVGQSVVWFGDIITIEKSYNSDKNAHIISLALGKQQPVPGVTVAFNQPLYEKELQLSSDSESDISKVYEVFSSAFKRWREKYNVGNASIGEKLYTGDFPFNEGGQPCIKCHSLDKRVPKSKGQGPNLISPNSPLIMGYEEHHSRRISVFNDPTHKATYGINPEDIIDIIAFLKERGKQSSK